MTEPGEAIQEARARLKKLAASMLVRKERAEKELAALEADQARVRAALEGLEPTAEATALAAEVDQKVEAKRAEVAAAEADLAAALREMDDLGRLKDTSEREILRATVQNLSSGADPFSRDPVDVALANVREHADELEARVRRNDELAPPRVIAATPDPVVREDPDAKARAILAELKAKKRLAAGDPPEGKDPPPKKRTL